MRDHIPPTRPEVVFTPHPAHPTAVIAALTGNSAPVREVLAGHSFRPLDEQTMILVRLDGEEAHHAHQAARALCEHGITVTLDDTLRRSAATPAAQQTPSEPGRVRQRGAKHRARSARTARTRIGVGAGTALAAGGTLLAVLLPHNGADSQRSVALEPTSATGTLTPAGTPDTEASRKPTEPGHQAATAAPVSSPARTGSAPATTAAQARRTSANDQPEQPDPASSPHRSRPRAGTPSRAPDFTEPQAGTATPWLLPLLTKLTSAFHPPLLPLPAQTPPAAPVTSRKLPAPGQSTPAPAKVEAPEKDGADRLRQEITDLVNKERATAGCPVVRLASQLTKAAQGHSDDMATRHFSDHTNPDGKEPDARIEAAGYQWTAYGENIAEGQPDPKTVMDTWMHSDGHRKNILNCAFTEIGVGINQDTGGPRWTQVFGTR